MPVFGIEGLRGRRKRRISEGAHATATISGLRRGSQYTVDPQWGQK
jgi:hypothetical protein